MNSVVYDVIERTSPAAAMHRTALVRALVVLLSLLTFTATGALAADLKMGDILVVDSHAASGHGAVILVDPATGAQSIISSGGLFKEPVSLAIDRDGSIVVSDRSARAIFRVDPQTGSQTYITSGGFIDPFGLALDSNGHIYVADSGWDQLTGVNVPGRIIRVDAATGSQTVLASGGFLNDPWTLAVESSGNIVVAESSSGVTPFTGQGGIIRIDASTGIQTPVSVFRFGPAGTPGCPLGITLDANGSILTSVFSHPAAPATPIYGCVPPAVFRVDPTTGATTTVSAYPKWGWQLPFGMDVDIDGTILVLDQSIKGVFRVDPADGTPTPISIGNLLAAPADIAVVKATPVGGGTPGPHLSLMNAGTASINEGGSTTVNGRFTAANAGDTHIASINWSDGGTTTLNLAAGIQTFSATHRYLDDSPTATLSDPYNISATVEDSGVSETKSTIIGVFNVAPVITGVSAPSGSRPLFSAIGISTTFTDAGVQDTHVCSVTWGDGATGFGLVMESNGSGSCTANHVYTIGGNYSVLVKVTDDDGGFSVSPVDLVIATTADTVAPTAPANLVAVATGASRINLTWTAAIDDVSVTGYRVERCIGAGCTNFNQIATSTAALYSDGNLTLGIVYRYRVRAADTSGNSSDYSSAVSVVTKASQTALATLAASMQPGTWAELSTVNIDPVLALTGGITGTTLTYSDTLVWDPVTQRAFFIGGDHDPQGGSGCPRFLSYAESTNAWQILPGASWFWCGPPASRMHGFNHTALDTVNGKLYHRKFGDMVVRKYDIATEVWSDLPAIPGNVMGYVSCCTGLAWFPERNSLLYVSIEDGTNGAAVEYSETTGLWTKIAGNLPMGAFQNFAKYNPVEKVVLFGGGEGDRHIYKLDSAGVVTALHDAPIPMGIENTVVTVDPVSGKYLIFGNANDFYVYDVTTDAWTLQGGAAPPIFSLPAYDPPIHGIVAAPISTYGVNLFARCVISSCKAYLYKYGGGQGSTGGSPDPTGSPDTTPPVISAVTASNVSGSTVAGAVVLSLTASDNVRVAGVQFRMDGLNLGAEVKSTPYFIIWDTSTVANGVHALSAVARDAAGNQTGSSAMTLLVSNTAPTQGGGGDEGDEDGTPTANPTGAATAFWIPSEGGESWTMTTPSESISVGHAEVRIDGGTAAVSGLAIFGFRVGGVLVTEAGVPATAPISAGRIIAEGNGPVNTGLAFANPTNQDATISFHFTDTQGADFGAGVFTLKANCQIAAFLNQAPFNGPASIQGTFTFDSSVPVGVIALRGFTNERSEFLITTLPVLPVTTKTTTGAIVVPHFAEGGGWTTQVVLTNPSSSPISGIVQFVSPGVVGQNAPALSISVNGVTKSVFEYSIPAHGSVRLVTGNAGDVVHSGSVRITPLSSIAPGAIAIFSFKSNGVTVSEAGVVALPAGMAFRMYAEVSGAASQIGSIESGLAIATLSPSPVSVILQLVDMDGASPVPPVAVTLPAGGQIARFIRELFPMLSSSFQGFVKATSTAPIAVTGLRGRYNERGAFLITTTPPSPEGQSLSGTWLMFPHIVTGGGYSTQFILSGQSSFGQLWLNSQIGGPLSTSLSHNP